MAKLPRPTGGEMVRFLQRLGIQVLRVRGSHHFMEGNGRRTCVPVHGSQPLRIGTLRSILRDLDMAPDDFIRRWGE